MSILKKLPQNGYYIVSLMGETLQGWIVKVRDIDGNIYVIKTANKYLHDTKSSFVQGHIGLTQDNILNEYNVMEKILSLNPPNNFIKPIEMFQNDNTYFLVMEYGGKHSLIHHTSKYHKYIKKGKLSINEWQRHCQVLFYQMITYYKYLYDIKLCHMDISLENMVIKGVKYNKSKNKFDCDGILKFIDYGCSKFYNNYDECLFNQFYGKYCYCSPEAFNIQYNKGNSYYNGILYDLWSIGICLFIIIHGRRPYNKPIINDKNFTNNIILNNYNNVSKDCSNLLNNIFKRENERYNIYDILNAPYYINIDKQYKSNTLREYMDNFDETNQNINSITSLIFEFTYKNS